MVRRTFNFTEKQINFLKKLPGTISEHIRRALDEYIDRMMGQNASFSQSKKKGSE
jgi:hypothetical protein